MTLRSKHPAAAGVALLAAVTLVGLLALGINLSFGLPFNLSLGLPPSQDYTLRAIFKDANGLARGAPVVEAGTAVGQVTGVEARGGEALVSMRVQHDYAPLHKGTIARIRYSTLLAQKYVELTPAAGTETIASGATIPSDQTVTPTDFDQFLSTLDPQTRQRLQVVVQQAGGGVEGRQAAINDLLDQLSNLSVESEPGLNMFANHSGDLGGILTHLAPVSKRLAQSHEQLGGFVQNTADVNSTLAAHDRDLVGFITHLANVMTDFDQTLNGQEQNLNTDVTTLDPLLSSLNYHLGVIYGYTDPNLDQFASGLDGLTNEIQSAISQRDANGNYLRQFVVQDACYDSFRQPSAGPGCTSALPALPNLSPPSLPTLPKLPCPSLPPAPSLPPNPLPTIAPCPSPLPCLPPSPRTRPSPSPSPSPCVGAGGAIVIPSPIPDFVGIMVGR